MTERERIIRDGILPESFFEEEVQCEFTVTRERKKIWAVGIDLLVKFDSVCRKHNLQYSLAFGSILGYIRHHGFIPWDDDIDVVMPRADYEKLKEYKDEFEQPYFLQFPREDEGYYFSFAKLRNSNTTGVSFPFRYEHFNQGLFLDIFPLDNYKGQNLQENVDKINHLIAECSALMRYSNPHPDEVDLKKMAQFPIKRDGQEVASELDIVLRQYEGERTDKYIAWCCPVYSSERMTFDKVLFDDLIEVDFYGHMVFIPRNYDEVLRITYGNYMEFPPVENRGTWHSTSVFDPDTPYKDTLFNMLTIDSSK